MESSVEVPQRAKNKTIIWFSNTTPFPNECKSENNRDVYHSNNHSSQPMEIAQMPYNWLADLKIMVYE
jgi:hypothetical protein